MKMECENLNYDFEVEERDVFLRISGWIVPRGYEKAENYKAIVNSENQSLLSIVSNKYQLIKHKEIVGMTRQILAERGIQDLSENITLTKNGARMFYHLDYGTPIVIKDQTGFHDLDTVSHGLRITNSYDGSMRIFIEGTGFRHICKNALTFPFEQIKRFVSAKLLCGPAGRKHIGLASLNGFEEYLRVWLDIQEHMPDIFNNIVAKELTADDFEKFDKIISSLPEIYRNRISDNLDSTDSDSLWTVYNAVTEATTHVREENKSIETLRNHSLVAAKVLALGE